MKNFKFLIFIAALFTQLIAFANEPIRYKFVKGEKYVYTQKTVQNIEQQMMGQAVSIQQIIEADYSMKVLEVLPNAAKVEMVYERMKMSTISPMASIVIDSEAGEEDTNPMTVIMKAMMKKPITLEMSSKGIFTKVEGLDKMHEAVLAEVAADPAMKLQAQGMLKQFMTEEVIVNGFKSSLVIYPEESIKIGSSWTDKMTDIPNVPAEVELTWTYTSANKFDAKLNYLPSAEPQYMNGATVKDLKGSATYQVTVNENKWATEFLINQEMSMTASAQGMTIPMTVKTETTIKLLD